MMLENVEKYLSYEYFDSILDVDTVQWDSVVSKATGLRANVLRTFEISGVNNLVCHYMLFHDKQGPVAKANLYEVSMDFTSLDKNLSPSVRNTIKKWHPRFLDLSMIECGLFAMNGDGLVVNDIDQLPEVINQVSQKLHDIANKKNLDLLVFRDVPLEHYQCYENLLLPLGYAPVAGFTNAVIDIVWPSLDEYLVCLNSKDRYKLKNALKIEEKFDIKIEVTSDYKHLAKDMAGLWANVNASSNDYNREQLDEKFFFESGIHLQDNSEVILFYHQDRLVAFMWNLIGDEDYHMADWGVDYDFPDYREANFYRAASVYSIKRAIELGKNRMQLGMTNYVPKKLLGAKMQPLIYFIKNRKNTHLSSVVARMMTDAIYQPEELNYYRSDTWSLVKMSADEYKELINTKVYDHPVNDAFHRIEANYEIDLLKLGGMYSFYPNADFTSVNLSRDTFVSYGQNPKIIQAGMQALEQLGAGYNGVPFFSGHSAIAVTLQNTIACLTSKAAVQLIACGSLIHNTALSALLDSDTVVLMDEQNGPNLWDAVNAADCEVLVYPHNSTEQLQELLCEHEHKKLLIVTEVVFPMRGECVDLKKICQFKNQYGARLYVDESYSFGLLGPKGKGLSAQQGVTENIDIVVASTLPGLGIDGGFIAGSTRVIDHIRHQSTPLLFSTNLSNLAVSMLTVILDQLESDGFERTTLFEKSEYLAHQLRVQGFEVVHYKFPIINIVLGDFMLALAAQKKLLDEGVIVSIVGPPMLPPETSSIRLTLQPGISWRQLDEVIDRFKAIGTDIGSS
jgi:8-amino-7-oxononanoate synthase